MVAAKKPNQDRLMQNRFRNMRIGGVNVENILTRGERTDKAALLTALERRLLQTTLTGKQEQTLREYLDSKDEVDDSEIRGAIRLIMCTPEYQLT
jgi:hypothetical protein